MITVPTRDLVGIIADTINFAHPKEDYPTAHGLLLTWADDTLTASAADLAPQHVAISRWRIDDYTGDSDGEQPDMFTTWGSDSGEDDWAIYLSHPDAKMIATAFKLPAKQGGTPLTLKYTPPASIADPSTARLTIRRVDVSPRTLEVSNVDGVAPGESRAAQGAITASMAAEDESADSPVSKIGVSQLFLAALAKVRPNGVSYLRFAGPDGLILAQIGARFVAVTQALKPE